LDDKLKELVFQTEPVSLYEPIRYISDGGGKRLRPILLIFSCECVGGNIESVLSAAVAVEMIHNFTLVHDDIMDHDDYRRGRQTVHRKWNEDVAILTGDALMVFAYQSLAKSDFKDLTGILDIFSKGVIEVCEGQALDKEFEKRSDVELEEYIKMVDKKTGRLIAVSTELGALIGGGDPETVRAFKKFGEKLGRAFQIQDDLLDIIAEQDVLGKDLGSDLIQDKKTYPLLLALKDPKNIKPVNDAIQKTKRGDVSTFKKLLEDIGIIEQVKKDMKDQIVMAKQALSNLDHKFKFDNIFTLSDMILRRES